MGEGDEFWETHERISYVYCQDRWVPYPFQNNLYCLPQGFLKDLSSENKREPPLRCFSHLIVNIDDQIECINGLIDCNINSLTTPDPTNFDEWILKFSFKNVIAEPFYFEFQGDGGGDCGYLHEAL